MSHRATIAISLVAATQLTYKKSNGAEPDPTTVHPATSIYPVVPDDSPHVSAKVCAGAVVQPEKPKSARLEKQGARMCVGRRAATRASVRIRILEESL